MRSWATVRTVAVNVCVVPASTITSSTVARAACVSSELVAAFGLSRMVSWEQVTFPYPWWTVVQSQRLVMA